MDEIIRLHVNFYEDLTGNNEVGAILEREGITVLDGFIQNIELVRRYYQTVYSMDANRIVLCGINPGRLGAGKTGIPFLDYNSVSCLFPDIQRNDQENSAQFVFSIIREIGCELFYRSVYMTNVSWFGFTKDGKNLNYDKLPSYLPSFFTDSFIGEMAIVQPKLIIPLGEKVEQTLRQMKQDGRLNYPLAKRLPHPFYCSIPTNTISCKQKYVDSITAFMKQTDVFI